MVAVKYVFTVEFADKTQLWATLQNDRICYGRMGFKGKAKELQDFLYDKKPETIRDEARRWVMKNGVGATYKNYP